MTFWSALIACSVGVVTLASTALKVGRFLMSSAAGSGPNATSTS